MAEAAATAVNRKMGGRAQGPFARFIWLGQERVFRWIPFILVEGTFVLVIIVPFLLTVYISLLRWRANRPFEQATLSGFRNYEQVLMDAGFWEALGRTFYFAGVAVVLELLIGFFLAMLVHRVSRGRRIYITIFLIPMMVVPVVVGYNFSMIYLDSGPLNQLLAPLIGPFGINPRIRWLSNPLAAQWAIILADVWQWTSLTFLIFLSGFSALPQQLINAARVMGANSRQIFFWVELPLLRPAIIIAIVIRSMEALKLFDPVVLLTFGGPGRSTQTIAYYLGAGVAVQQVLVWRRRLHPASNHLLDLHLYRDMAAHAPERPGRTRANHVTTRTVSKRRLQRSGVRHAILIAWAVTIMFPIFWMLQTSFKDAGEWVSWPRIGCRTTRRSRTMLRYSHSTWLVPASRVRRQSSPSTSGARSPKLAHCLHHLRADCAADGNLSRLRDLTVQCWRRSVPPYGAARAHDPTDRDRHTAADVLRGHGALCDGVRTGYAPIALRHAHRPQHALRCDYAALCDLDDA